MAPSAFWAVLMLSWIAPLQCLNSMKADGPSMIAVSPDKLHSCIQGPKSKFDAAASWTRDSATVVKEGTCEEYFSLQQEIPVKAFSMDNEAPFCVDLTAWGAPGLRECWVSHDEVLAHVKHAR
mmetsp:Transcript_28520/g.57656  ORF Transcript_28520/g.57656 Transcript_28520/m.57656 type:complete len:123 (+) Transcript_28520:2-370(+)